MTGMTRRLLDEMQQDPAHRLFGIHGWRPTEVGYFRHDLLGLLCGIRIRAEQAGQRLFTVHPKVIRPVLNGPQTR